MKNIDQVKESINILKVNELLMVKRAGILRLPRAARTVDMPLDGGHVGR